MSSDCGCAHCGCGDDETKNPTPEEKVDDLKKDVDELGLGVEVEEAEEEKKIKE